MQPDEYIIDQLGIEAFSNAEQQDMLNEVRILIGEAVSDELTDAQLDEYQSIIDADDKVIQPWLKNNVPNYKELPAYQQFAEEYKTDPEMNDPAKLFATLAWIELNVTNSKEITDAVISDYKKKHLSTS